MKKSPRYYVAFPTLDSITLPGWIETSRPALVRKLEHELRRVYTYPKWCQVMVTGVEIRAYASRKSAKDARFSDKVGQNGRIL